jgi:hypothetical protein
MDMLTRIGGFRHVSFYITVAVAACILVCSGHGVVEAQCLDCGNDLCGCPAPDPMLETTPGPSLYFNDPCGGGYECCWTRFYCHDGSPADWFVSAEFMPLFRDEGGSLPMQSRGPAYIRDVVAVPPDGVDFYDFGSPVPDIILGTGDFDAELAPGVRITIGHALGDWYRIEGSWRGSYSWSDSVTVRDPDSELYSPFSNFGDPDHYVGLGDPAQPQFAAESGDLDLNYRATIAFASEMNDVELNLRRRVRMRRGGAVHGRRRGTGEASFLVGLRYMDISETFNYLTASEEGLNTVAVSTDNDMFGVQIGGLAQILVHDRAWVDVDIKGVAFFNQAGAESTYTDPDDRPFTFGDEEDRATFMGDLSVTLNYQFARAWTFRVGYNALWLSGVALATENFKADITTLERGPGNVNHSGNVTYHGPQIGFVWAR